MGNMERYRIPHARKYLGYIGFSAFLAGLSFIAGTVSHELPRTVRHWNSTLSVLEQSVASHEAERANQREQRQQVPQSVFASIDNATRYIVYCDKHPNTTALYEVRDQQAQLLYSFPHTDGKGGSGPKQQKGDGKTPELQCSIDDILFRGYGLNDSPLYGAAIISLNTPFDGILICGTDFTARTDAIQKRIDASNGSIVLRNHDVLLLAKTIQPYQRNTKVIIEDSRRSLSG